MPEGIAQGRGARPPLPVPPAASLLLLGSLVLLAIFLDLEPLLTFSAWGSDTGEYAVMTAHLLQTHGFLLSGYTGWGFGYPYFPGTFEVGAGVAAAAGTDPLWTLEVAIPVLASLSVVPIYLLFRRLYPSEPVALIGAALAAVAFPRVFILSHAAPASLGDLLVVAGLWLLVEQRRDPRWLLLLGLDGVGLIVTHHLSSYFFLLSALGLLVGVELYAPHRWSRRFPLREFVFLGGFTSTLLAYWYYYAPPFRSILEQGLLGAPPIVAAGAALGIVALGAVLVLLRRKLPTLRDRPLWRTKWPVPRKVLRDASVLSLLLGVGIAYLLVEPLPGTSDVVPVVDVLYFLPFLVLVPLVAGGRSLGSLTSLGEGPLAWFGAIAASAAFALRTANSAIPPDRHVEYLALPLVLLAAMTIGSLISDLHASGRRRALVAVVLGVGLLVGANAAVCYPPPSLLEGFQEGFTAQDTALASWAVSSLPAGSALASDHRLSDLYFGYSGWPATWSAAPCLFVGENTSCARQELQDLSFPLAHFAPRPLDAVAVDPVMVQQGVALNPNAPAVPMSASALAYLEGPGFILLYSDGGASVWWVDSWALAPLNATAGPASG